MFQFIFITAFALLSVLAPQNTGVLMAEYHKAKDPERVAPTLFDEDWYAHNKRECENDVVRSKENFKDTQAEHRIWLPMLRDERREYRQCLRAEEATAFASFNKNILDDEKRVWARLTALLVCPEPERKPRWFPPICVDDLRYERQHVGQEPCTVMCWLRLKQEQTGALYHGVVSQIYYETGLYDRVRNLAEQVAKK